MGSKRHVIVIGAGVTGLTSALFLAEAGYRVTVVAANVPGDESIEYTSPWAGAHWNSSATDARTRDWDVQTYDYWVDILRREAGDRRLPKSGLKMQDSFSFWSRRPDAEFYWWAPYVAGFRQLSTVADPVGSINEQTPDSEPQIIWGVCARLPSLNVPQYLLYIQEKGRLLSVEVLKTKLPFEEGLEKALRASEDVVKQKGRGEADCFVNATGLSAKVLCGDEAMHPIRGQTVLVKGEASATRTRYDGDGSYCIPRPGSGTTILGGVKQKNNWSEAEDPQTTKQILERNRTLAPELLTGSDGGFEVISVQVGLRPGRSGGARMERETVGGKKVVHAYGHGAAGYQNSIGSARLVVQLVTESTGGSNIIASRL